MREFVFTRVPLHTSSSLFTSLKPCQWSLQLSFYLSVEPHGYFSYTFPSTLPSFKRTFFVSELVSSNDSFASLQKRFFKTLIFLSLPAGWNPPGGGGLACFWDFKTRIKKNLFASPSVIAILFNMSQKLRNPRVLFADRGLNGDSCRIEVNLGERGRFRRMF